MLPEPNSNRATQWQLRDSRVTFGRQPVLMGIVNVTPDSFSDGGCFHDPGHAVEQALQLADAGASILDIGGESTRPYSRPVEAAEELRRVKPVLIELCRQTTVPVSVDTSKAVVARMALDCGADIINDITGLEADPGMIPLAAQAKAGVCAMHMQGTPQTMQDAPTYHNVVTDIRDYLARRRDSLLEGGIDRARICLDPGIGFGKSHQHNLTLLANCWQLHELGCPLLVGHSRKGFIGKVLGDKDVDRTAGTIGVALSLAIQGVQIIRVHDVAAVAQAIQLFDAAGGIDGAPAQVRPSSE